MRYAFDSRKPFYPLVMTYYAQLHGLKLIIASGALEAANLGTALTISPMIGDHSADVNKAINSLLGPLNLDVTGEIDSIDINLGFVAKEIATNFHDLLSLQVKAASFCLAMAYEYIIDQVKEQPFSNDPKWQFLRHCRNAISHNGKWKFKKGEPKVNAQWRTISLSISMDDKPLFRQEDGTGYLRPGDPIAILWDIENDPNFPI